MKYIVPVASAILASLLQITIPTGMISYLLVLDITFVVIIIISIRLKSHAAAIWIALVAGLVIDIWLPSHFGVWTIASIVVALIVIIINAKILPRRNVLSLTISAGLGLFAGTFIVYVVSLFGSNLSLLEHLIDYLRFYLVKIPLDLLLFWLLLVVVKKVTLIFYPNHDAW